MLFSGERHRDNVLQMIGASLKAWVIQAKREKAIYHVLNKCSVDVTRKVLVAEAWCPVSAKPRVQEALLEAAHATAASVSAPTQHHFMQMSIWSVPSSTAISLSVSVRRALFLPCVGVCRRWGLFSSQSSHMRCRLHTLRPQKSPAAFRKLSMHTALPDIERPTLR
jgi:hypothetical protein